MLDWKTGNVGSLVTVVLANDNDTNYILQYYQDMQTISLLTILNFYAFFVGDVKTRN